MEHADLTKRMIGHASAMAIRMIEVATLRRGSNRRGSIGHSDELDRTGICVSAARRLEIKWQDGEVLFPWYEDSLAHSLWRAQEFSLFMRHRKLLQPPILDFGCGDGSFAAALFDTVDLGVDIDDQALHLARQFGLYSKLIKANGPQVPLADGAAGSVFSNSVLEHVQGLEAVIAEIARLLQTSGLFIFTVPVAQFARDLEKYFGRDESIQVNADYFHRNLLEIEEWCELLARHGLSVVSMQEYQPARFSYYYMMLRLLGNRALGRFFPNIRQSVWHRRSDSLVEMVRRSTDGTVRPGGNVFVVARKDG